jgi:cytochrome c oxidase subunit I+III
MLLLASAAGLHWCSRRLGRGQEQRPLQVVLAIALLMLCASIVVELRAHLGTAWRPQQSAYAAAVYMLVALQAFFVVITACMGLYTLVRSLAGRLAPERRVTFDNTLLFWYYTVAQGLLALLLVHGFPAAVG